MKILYVHVTRAFGGSSKSLIELIKVLKQKNVEGTIFCPHGNSAKSFSKEGLSVSEVKGIAQWDNTEFGYYRGQRWVILLREFFHFPSTFFSLRKLIKGQRFDLIHLNEATLLPWAYFIKRWSKIPVILHVRSVQRFSVSDWRDPILNYLLKNHVDKIICIDETVKRSLPKGLPISVIHNSLIISPKKTYKKNEKIFTVGIVGALLKLKGIYEFLDASRILIHQRKLKMEFQIFGENPHKFKGIKTKFLSKLNLAQDVKREVEEIIKKEKLGENIKLLGFKPSISEIYNSINLLCFPSHLNAAGRPVFEAAFHEIPSIVAIKNPPSDSILDGITGICIDRPDGFLLANAIEKLFLNPTELEYLGKNAKRLAEHFYCPIKNGNEMLVIYNDLIKSK